jgi:hypothetical protein
MERRVPGREKPPSVTLVVDEAAVILPVHPA